MNFILVLLLWLLKYSSAQGSNCIYYQSVLAGTTYYIYSPNWSNYYSAGLDCRWFVTCPQGYNCRLECPEIRIPQSTACSGDRLLVSLTGDLQLAGAQTYCGTGTLKLTSTGQQISIGLRTSQSTPGGRFQCQVTALPATTTPQPCRCGERRLNRIVGGQETGINEFTMMAAIADRQSTIRCGAVIISPWNVVTAAHCFYNQSISSFAVVVGEHDITIGDSPTQAFAISSVTIHPLYSSSNYDYDIAIVTVAGTIQFNDRVLPVCLPFKFANNDFAGRKVTVLGWGTVFVGGPTSNVLRKVDVDVIDQVACKRQLTAVTDRQMCTYTPGKDACQYDSGGPVLYTDPATGLLFSVGIVSYGRYCASPQPAINTRITVLLNWIINNTQYNYCVK